MLPEQFTAVMGAIAAASPHGLAIVEEAIDDAIASVNKEIKKLNQQNFGVDGFIPKSAFGAAERSPEIALHHTRAHAVMEETLGGVRKDLITFRDACALARDDIKGVDQGAADDLKVRTRLVDGLAVSVTDHGDGAYRGAVQDNGGLTASENNPYED